MSDIAAGRQGKEVRATTADDGEAAYVQKLVHALRKRKNSTEVLLSLLNDPDVADTSLWGRYAPGTLWDHYSNLRGFVAKYADVFLLYNHPARPKKWFVSLRDKGGDDDELAYLKEFAACLQPVWLAGASIGEHCLLPQHLKTRGLTLQQLIIKFPNIVEMKVEGTATAYRRAEAKAKEARVDGLEPARTRLRNAAGQPNNPNLRLPKEFRDGDWTCERHGCGNVNFARREKCGSFDCDATRPAGAPSMTSIRGDDKELAYMIKVAALLSPDSWSAGGILGKMCPLPLHLKTKGVTLKQLVVKYPNVIEIDMVADEFSYRRAQGVHLDGFEPEEQTQLAYFKKVMALMSSTSWYGGGILGTKCPVPQYLKTEGVTLKQVLLKYPDMVEMRQNVGGDMSFRRAVKVRLADPVLVPSKPSIAGPPDGFRSGDWKCERKGCKMVNFSKRQTCRNPNCDGARPTRSAPGAVLQTPSLLSPSSFSSPPPPAPPPPYTPEDEGAISAEEDAFVRHVAAGLDKRWVRLHPCFTQSLVLYVRALTLIFSHCAD
jgi:hypothetical protein